MNIPYLSTKNWTVKLYIESTKGGSVFWQEVMNRRQLNRLECTDPRVLVFKRNVLDPESTETCCRDGTVTIGSYGQELQLIFYIVLSPPRNRADDAF